ncbi:MAG: helix-hairpin-helix domain-containing protein [Treponema sp.]
MEFTKEFIEGLSIDEDFILQETATSAGVLLFQAKAVISLLNEGCTIPFISRYRKEKHGNLNEVQVRDCEKFHNSITNMETRRLEIIKGIFNEGKLTEALYNNIKKAHTLTELEDIWLPFKKKKKTRGMLANEKGLAPLAEIIKLETEENVILKAKDFIKLDAENEKLNVPTVEDAIQGAKDIIAEETSQSTENRKLILDFFTNTGKFVVKGVGDEEKQKTSVYQMYWDYTEPIKSIKAHRVLAINRGEKEGELAVQLEVDLEEGIKILEGEAILHNRYHKEAIADGFLRLLSPQVLREIRGDLSEIADVHGISIFSENLKNLLMASPIKGTRVLAFDPGIRTGTKCAALDETGKYLGSFVIYQNKADEATVSIIKAIKDYNIALIAIGNGTASHEVQELVSNVIKSSCPNVLFTVVDEDGASVYSAGDVAREEFPNLDLTIRGAISIGRRLQDPLAELVKIEPKSIGVGLYQHDLNQKKLGEELSSVVSSVVNTVGVNLNTASSSLLKYVSGINSSLAKKIVARREEKGIFKNREDLKDISGMGEKIFEQCAGFLKIPESDNPLDNSWVHPENYDVGKVIYDIVSKHEEVSNNVKEKLEKDYSVSNSTLEDIIQELKKPNRDPREDFPKPIMQQGVLKFEDLKEGMKVKGKVKNVVDFGAFIDLGIKETALLHISEMSDSFIKEPLELLKVGEILECKIIALDENRRRISLSRKKDASIEATTGTNVKKEDAIKEVVINGGKKVLIKKKASTKDKNEKPIEKKLDKKPFENKKNLKDDDGTKYNPFAALMKNKK